MLARKKLGEWMKKFDKLESLQLEFELASCPKLEPFLEEITEKVNHMASFKKMFMKTMLQTEAMLKKKVDYI